MTGAEKRTQKEHRRACRPAAAHLAYPDGLRLRHPAPSPRRAAAALPAEAPARPAPPQRAARQQQGPARPGPARRGAAHSLIRSSAT